MRGTKEFYELREHFEKDVKTGMYGHTVEREKKDAKVPVDVFYTDGYVNQLFLSYMRGYSLGKCVER